MIKNPWKDMARGSQRRASLYHDIYWIKEEMEGNYGLKLSLKNSEENLKIKELKLKNIDIFENKNEDKTDLYLMLNSLYDYDIFNSLCMDLIEECENYSEKVEIYVVVFNRLTRWKNLLLNNKEKSLPIELQMGLFSELDTLLSIVLTKKTSLKEAVLSWGGPDSDKQDFILDKLALEVKSHKTGKNEVIHVSSPQQLFSSKNRLVLRVYSLDIKENGDTVENLIQQIKHELKNNNLFNEMYIFEQKIVQYGYKDDFHKDTLYKFHIDKISNFDVRNDFPRVDLESIPSGIINMKYQLNLNNCKDYLIDDWNEV